MQDDNYHQISYPDNKAGSLSSAQVVVRYLIDWLDPRSVIDIGCGVGAWLQVFREHGVSDILGVDGSWIERNKLLIPAECFQAANFENKLSIEKQADLAISLEVAEHLSPALSQDFVKTLTQIAPVVLFSAAIPRQPGHLHINCKWPSAWAEHFASCDYVPIDCLRPLIWNHSPTVRYWYAQNLILYVKQDFLANHSTLQELYRQSPPTLMNLVHPELFESLLGATDPENVSIRNAWRQLVTSLKRRFMQ